MTRRAVWGAALLGACIVMISGGAAAADLRPATITAGYASGNGTAVWGPWRPLWDAVPRTAAVIRVALGYLGRPYQWAGIGRGGFDCSGLVSRVFSSAGIALPHTSSGLYDGGLAVPSASLGPGDLVFFRTYNSGPSHVGIYLGDNRFIHASASQGVIISSMDEPYYRTRYLGARRY